MQMTHNGWKLLDKKTIRSSVFGGNHLHKYPPHLVQVACHPETNALTTMSLSSSIQIYFLTLQHPWFTIFKHTHTSLSPAGSVEVVTKLSLLWKNRGGKITDLLQNWPYSAVGEYQIIELVHAELSLPMENDLLQIVFVFVCVFCSWSRAGVCCECIASG